MSFRGKKVETGSVEMASGEMVKTGFAGMASWKKVETDFVRTFFRGRRRESASVPQPKRRGSSA